MKLNSSIELHCKIGSFPHAEYLVITSSTVFLFVLSIQVCSFVLCICLISRSVSCYYFPHVVFVSFLPFSLSWICHFSCCLLFWLYHLDFLRSSSLEMHAVSSECFGFWHLILCRCGQCCEVKRIGIRTIDFIKWHHDHRLLLFELIEYLFAFAY